MAKSAWRSITLKIFELEQRKTRINQKLPTNKNNIEN